MRKHLACLLRRTANRIDPPRPAPVYNSNATCTTGTVTYVYTPYQ